jgi:hypothetical protein
MLERLVRRVIAEALRPPCNRMACTNPDRFVVRYAGCRRPHAPVLASDAFVRGAADNAHRRADGCFAIGRPGRAGRRTSFRCVVCVGSDEAQRIIAASRQAL